MSEQRLIDAEALRTSAIKATGNDDFAFDNCYPYWQFSKCIKEAPTIDAVPVVRCKDCAHYEDEKHKIFQNCIRNGRLTPMLPDDYCSYGARMDGC